MNWMKLNGKKKTSLLWKFSFCVLIDMWARTIRSQNSRYNIHIKTFNRYWTTICEYFLFGFNGRKKKLWNLFWISWRFRMNEQLKLMICKGSNEFQNLLQIRIYISRLGVLQKNNNREKKMTIELYRFYVE